MKRGIAPILVVLVLSLFSTRVNAVTVPIEVFTNNGVYYNGPEIVLFFEVIPDVYTIDFEFHNDSTVMSSIAEIYFDDSSLLTNLTIIGGAGTAFSTPDAPANLPGGKSMSLPFYADFVAGADAPAPENGANPGEMLTIRFDYADGVTGTNIIEALNDFSLRIGVHLIALPDGSSEAGVHVPEPASVFILGLGMILILRKPKRK